MSNYLKSELLKQKHSFNNIIIWLIPVVNIVIAYFSIGPNYIQIESYNWWYILFLPFTFTYISSTIISKEKKYNFHGLFSISKSKKQLWYAKIGAGTIYLFITCLIFMFSSLICGFIFNEQIAVINNVFASLLLIITFAWQIPLFMFITYKSNKFLSIALSIVCNLLVACICAVESYWWIPFAIPARLMCPTINVLPNGLIVPVDSTLKNGNVILIGSIITLILYFLISVITANSFNKQEV